VRTTITHPFLTGDGWKPLAEICVGDRVAVPRAIDVEGNESLPEADIVMLGFLIGSGCLADGSPMMSTASPSVLLELQRCAAKLGVTVRHTSPHDHRLCTPLGRPSPVTTLLRRHGLWKTESRAKHIPDAVYRLPAKQLALFLNRLFAANGRASVPKGDRTWRSVSEAAGKPANYNWHVGTRSPQRATLALLAEVLDARDLELLATSDIWWDEVVSIVYVGDEQVYDLTVPHVHNFVA